ncbi:MAG: 50S ribosomal protein L37ae [Nanoarchaeota archaeon]
MGKTKKVGTSGRFGVRYGKRIRQLIIDIEKKQRKKHTCPYCNKQTVKRIAKGVWKCKKCEVKFTGKAYYPGE